MLLSFTQVTLRVLALLGQVTWTGTVYFRGGRGGDATSIPTTSAALDCDGCDRPILEISWGVCQFQDRSRIMHAHVWAPPHYMALATTTYFTPHPAAARQIQTSLHL